MSSTPAALELANLKRHKRIDAWLEAVEWAKTFSPRFSGTLSTLPS